MVIVTEWVQYRALDLDADEERDGAAGRGRPAQHLSPRGHGGAGLHLRQRRAGVASRRFLPFSPCGRRWREAPDEGSLDHGGCCETPHPSRSHCASDPPSPTRGEGKTQMRAAIAPHLRHPASDRRRARRTRRARWRRSNAAVLVAPPGAGKTTRVPLALLDAPWLQRQEDHHAGAAPDRGARQRRADGADARRARRRDRRLSRPLRLEDLARDADRGRHRRHLLAADSRRSRTDRRRRGAVRRISRTFARCRSGPGAGARCADRACARICASW